MGVLLVRGAPVVRLAIGTSIEGSWQLGSGIVKSHWNIRGRRPRRSSTGDNGLVVDQHPSRIKETLVPLIDHASDAGLSLRTIMCAMTGCNAASIAIRCLAWNQVASECIPVGSCDISRSIVRVRLREPNVFSSRSRCNCQRVLEHEAWGLKCVWPFIEVLGGGMMPWRFATNVPTAETN